MAGLTDRERALVDALGECWNAFLELPTEHTDDRAEFRHGLHALQNMILARPMVRNLRGGVG